jgi:Cu(I)/Ag(I) efflux system membrane fusion protein
VQIGAIVRDTDAATASVTLQHDPVPEWSWPSMTMSFDVADRSLLAGLQEGQPVDIVIERYADGRHRVTEILAKPGAAADEKDNEPPAAPETDRNPSEPEAGQ